ncbi:MAG: hypothetical protein JOY80_03835 [Candidatus Dormibacteraeota bacterium]|nr:hypothetical protein [Candidatus Dormibacteraeota bacterium]
MGLQAMRAEAKHGAWVGQVIAQARRLAKAAGDETTSFVGVGMQHGARDAADFLGTRLRASRLFRPQPDVHPTGERELHSYLAGYLAGHLIVRVAAEIAAAGDVPSEEQLQSVMNAAAPYAAGVASPEMQRRLAMDGVKGVLVAHHVAMSWVDREVGLLDEARELQLFRWLAARQDLEVTENLVTQVRRMRAKRGAPAPPAS